MLNGIKYSMIRALRDKEFMFSSILVAVLMGTVMYFMTGSMMDEVNEGTLEINVAVVEIAGSEQSMFIDILQSIDMFELDFVNREEALYLLETGDVDGIFEVGSRPHLLVTESFFRQLILQTVADEYVMNGEIFTTIGNENPQYLEAAMMSMVDQRAIMAEMEIAEHVIDMMQMFMIMFVTTGALSGIFVGFERAIMVNNDGKTASRRLVSSFGKINLLVADLLGAAFVIVLIAFAIWGYFTLVLGVALEVNLALAAVSFFLTGLFGLTFGAFFGLVAPGKRKAREQILNGAYMGMIMIGFFGAQMPVPMIQRINDFNPLMLLVDAIMALNLGSYDRYIGFMVTIGILTVVMFVATIIALRRNRHVDAK